ncbi:MAG: hypothetical protein ABR600_14635 [Actinomycetota bacterium]
MTFSWTYLDGTGEQAGRSDPFEDRGTAEEWMGRAWEELLEGGVEEVALQDDDRGRRVYRMSLRAS